MNALSLVKDEKIQKDPRNLAYLFPSMPVGKYKVLTEQYYKAKTLRAIEEVASINNQLLIPARCLHWERKKKFKDQKINFFGKAYYLINVDDVTETELEKYKDIVYS